MVSSLYIKFGKMVCVSILVTGIYLFLSSLFISQALAQNQTVSPQQQAQFQSYVDKANGYLEKHKIKKAIKAFKNALKYGDHPLIRLELARSIPIYYGEAKEAEALNHCQVLVQQGYPFLSKFCTASYASKVYQMGLSYGAHYYRLRAPYLGRALGDLSPVIDNLQDLPRLTNEENLKLHKEALEEYATLLLYNDDAASALSYIKTAQALTPEDANLSYLEASALSKDQKFPESERILRALITRQFSSPDSSSFFQKAKINSYKTVLAYILTRQEKYPEAMSIFDGFENKSFTKFYIDNPFIAALAALKVGRNTQAEKYINWAAERKSKLATGGKSTFNYEKPNLYSQTVSADLITLLHGRILVAQGRGSEAARLAPNNPAYLASLNQDTPLMAQASGQGASAGERASNDILTTPARNTTPVNPNPLGGERRGWIGISMAETTVTLEDKKTGKQRDEKGILVTGVEKDGPAHLSSILQGDKIIIGLDGMEYSTIAEFAEKVKNSKVNYTFVLWLVRNNVQEIINVKNLVIGARDQSLPFRRALFAYWNMETEKAFNLMLQEAETGNYEAQYWLGVIYRKQENDEETLKWFLLAGEQGHVDAQYSLGLIYSLGKGTPEDNVAAAKWTLRAAEQGHELAQSSTASNYALGDGVPRDYAEAFKWKLILAEGGNLVYQNAVGQDYEKGVGVPEDMAEATRWYELSAKNEYDGAQLSLGRLYETGKGVKFQSYREAARWYLLAAEQGNWDAQDRIGEMYEQGLGVPENYVTAFMWFNLLAARGFEWGINKRNLLREKMTPDQIAEGQRLSADWFEEHQ